MVELKTIELLLQLPNLLPICCHAGVVTVWLSHDLVHDELRVIADIKPLNPNLSGDAQAVDKRLVFHHIVGATEVQPKHIEETVSLRIDQHYASPGPIEGDRAITICAPVLLGDQGGSCWVSVHSAMKYAKA
jgi:hypothetical protein